MTASLRLELRRFEVAYTDSVWELHNRALNEVGAHAGNGPWDADLHSITRTYLDGGGEFLVGLLDDRLVAMGALRRVDDRAAEIKRMRVHPDFQRQGFGRFVLAALERRAMELGYQTLRLDTALVQVAAQRLYKAAGYREVGRGELAGFDVIYFEKTLR